MNAALRKRWYNAFNPHQSLAPDHPFNVDIDRLDRGARGFPWAERLADQVALSDAPAQVFFSGLQGSGISTELKRMVTLLEAPPRDERLVAYVDAKDTIDLQNAIDVPDLLAALVQGAEQAVLQLENRDPSQALEEGFLPRLWNWLKNTDMELTQAQFSVPSGAALVAEMKSRPSLRGRLRKVLNAHLTRFLEDVRKELEQLDSRARKAGRPGGLVVVFDTLEKLMGSSETFDPVLGSAERVFARDAPWFDLPVPVVWTLPPALVTRTRLQVDFLPMIKLHHRENGAPYAGGFQILRTVVGRRASDDDLRQMLGENADAKLNDLFLASGGYVRDLLRMLQELALLHAPATEDDVARAIAGLHDEILRIIPTKAYPWLARVAARHSIATADDAEKALADRLIGNNVVLRYQNRSTWYDVHPAARHIPEVATPGALVTAT